MSWSEAFMFEAWPRGSDGPGVIAFHVRTGLAVIETQARTRFKNCERAGERLVGLLALVEGVSVEEP